MFFLEIISIFVVFVLLCAIASFAPIVPNIIKIMNKISEIVFKKFQDKFAFIKSIIIYHNKAL